MFVEKHIAEDFLEKYKSIMAFLNNGENANGASEYAELREKIYSDFRLNKNSFSKLVGNEFIASIEKAVFDKFVYLKRYQKGYVMLSTSNNMYYQVHALTSPLEEIAEDYILIETALIPYAGVWVCDGLILRYASLGKDIQKSVRDGYWEAKRAGKLQIHV
ncbi:hypothetical protein [Microbulbifer sp. ANSA005]|uniref:hypothetical protein n=1 Tax=Microbulbifer sp. ANSA005 TaxID=3243362 RepID=UPI004042DEEB